MQTSIPDPDIQAGSPGLSMPDVLEYYGLTVIRRDRPNIIVVGPDGVGKTTVVRVLSQSLGLPTFKCPTEKEIFRNGGRESLAFDLMLTHFLRQTGYRFISDRGHPCEWVYSSVFGRDTDMERLYAIDRAHADLGTRILYLYSSVPPFVRDDLVPPERYNQVVSCYERFIAWTACRVTGFDTAGMLTQFHTNGNDIVDQVVDAIIEQMEIT